MRIASRRSEATWRGATLLRRFAIGALAMFAVVAGLLYTLMRADAVNDVKKRAATVASIISSSLEASGAVTEEDLTTGVPLPRLLQRLGPVASALNVNEDGAWEDVRVYALDGRILVAREVALIGRVVPPGDAVAAAGTGSVHQEFVGQDEAAERFSFLSVRDKLVTTVPFHLNGRTVGALEVVQSVEAESAAFRSGITTKLAIVGGGLLLLYLGLLPVVSRASRAQEEQKRITAALLDKERATVEQLRQLDQAKDDLLAFSAHEFRTPLTSLLGFAQTLRLRRSELDDAMVDEYLHTIERQARRLQRVANDFLDAAAIEAGRLDVVVEEVPTLQIARNIASEFVEEGVEVRADAKPLVLADQDRLEQILTNLVRNAIQHGPKGSPIRVSVGVAGEYCRFDVSDDGPGLPDQDAARVFEKFERGPGRSEGSGLGLYISRHLAEAQRGRLTYVPDAGVTTFRLEIPLAPPRPVDAPGLEVLVAATPAEGSSEAVHA